MYFNGGLNESYNNIFARVGTGYAMYLGGSFSLTASDYNAYATYDGASQGLSYMTNLGYDANSLQIGGEIFSKTDSLFTCKDSLVGAGIFLTDVPNDINLSARNQQGPTIGPEEYVTPDGFSLGDDIQICDGDTVYIGQEVSGGTYVWTPGGAVTGILPVTSTGTYSVTVTGACGVADDAIVVESGNSTAAFNTTPSWLTAQFSNTSLNATTYSWDFGDGSALSTDMNPTHLYAVTGTYTVCLTATGECGPNTTCDNNVFVSDHIGIGENSASNVVNIYPNPASSDLTIAVEGVEGNSLNIEISNVAGQVVLTRQLNDFNGSAKENVDINGLKEGVYFVKIFSSEMTTTKRLVVQQ
jgi:hypothetical protein